MHKECEVYTSKMSKTIDVLKSDFATVRAGRANASVLDKLSVEHYGSAMPINQLASISVPEPRMLAIQPWDKSALKAIEKALGHARHHVVVCLPYSMGGMVETIHNNAQVKNVEYTGEGIEIETVLDDILYGRLREYVVKEC